jgi:uncharacterized protein (TIGR02453 family)
MSKNKTQADFSPELFTFLKQLKRNNNREWFAKNKDRYETVIREPSLAFIGAFQPYLDQISPAFLAVPKKVGGSLMRVHRDTRFAKDKTPYKTNVGIQFRHELGKDVHAPGFYIHMDPNECFLGAGIWHPESDALQKIRLAIDTQPTKWTRARDNKRFRDNYTLAGDSLKTVPRGYDEAHPLIADLRRKDFIAVRNLAPDDVVSADFSKLVSNAFRAASPLMQFLCDALQLPF